MNSIMLSCSSDLMNKKSLQIVKDIRNMKIRGAERIARAGIEAWRLESNKEEITKMLIAQRPTEPMLRNVLKILNKKGDPDSLLKMLEDARKKIIEYGARKIEDGDVIYTHCNSSTVEEVLIEAKKKGIEFRVNLTETRPLFQGRTTAEHLSKNGIDVTMFVDSAAKFAIRKSDKMFIGCDAIESDGVINKIGSGLMADVAYRYDVPLYVLTNALKFNPETFEGKSVKIETRSEKEVWENKPKGVKILNISFEKVRMERITSIISELGVLKPEVFLIEVKRAYSWIFE